MLIMIEFRLILLLYFLCITTNSVLSGNVVDSTDDTLKFIRNSQSQLNLPKNSNIILVIGNTGCGKSTLVHYVAGDYSRIKSIDDGQSVDLMVRDELDPGVDSIKSTTISRTFIPETNIDDEQNVWIDCPGFGDTRNQTIEIAAAFLIKSIIESAKSIKIVMVADFQSVTKSYNRNSFDKLLSHTTQLITNIKRFENSVSFVVTKVPSIKIRGRHFVDVLDESVKIGIEEFMRNHTTVLQEKESNEDHKMQLIDFQLKRSSDGDFPRISIFWRPNEIGPFDTIEKMIIGRQKIRKSILEQISYAEMHKNDFGFPLSAEAIIRIANLTEHTIDNITMNLKNINNRLQNELQQTIKSVDGFQKRLELIESGEKCVEFNTYSDVVTLKQITFQLHNLISIFNVTSIDRNLFNQIDQQVNNLNILNSLMGTATIVPYDNLNSISKQLLDLFIDLKENVYADIVAESQQLIENITNILINTDNQWHLELQNQLQSTVGFQNKLDLLQLSKNCTRSAREDVTLMQRTDQLKSFVRTFNSMSIDEIELNRMENLERKLNHLKSISKSEIVIPVRDWIATSSKAIDFQCTEYEWYSFLAQTYQELRKYYIQQNITAYNVCNLEHWGQLNKPQGLSIDEHNFVQFTNRIAFGSEFVPTSSRFEELNEIIRITLKSTPKYECSNSTMTIKGVFVKSSDIQLTMCPSTNVQKINVFAMDTFFVDGDLNFIKVTQVELNILSYTWNVIKTATFFLNGANGTNQAPPTNSGIAGRPGRPGTNAGNFFGLANKVVNGDALTVQLIGGRGGNGQDGTGNVDVGIAFDQGFDTQTYGDQNVTNHLINLIKSKSGINHIETISKEDYLKGYAVFWGAGQYKHKFRLFPNRCCGATGLGGHGKEKK